MTRSNPTKENCGFLQHVLAGKILNPMLFSAFVFLWGCNIFSSTDTTCNPDFSCSNTVADQWTYLGLGGESVTSVAVNPCDPSEIFAGTSFHYSDGRIGKIFRTRDCGESWQQVYFGGSFNQIEFDPQNSKTIYALYTKPRGDLLRSLDGGDSWQVVTGDIELMAYSNVNALALHPKYHNNLFLSHSGGWIGGGGRLLKSEDAGRTWQKTERESGNYTWGAVFPLFIHPQHTNIMLTGEHPSGFVFRSVDGGITWRSVDRWYFGNTMKFHYTPDKIWMLRTRFDRDRKTGPLFYSKDLGETWSGLTVIDTLHIYYDLFIDKGQNKYLATNEGVLTDGTGSWKWINEGFEVFGDALPAIRSLASDPEKINIYAGMDYTDYNKPYRGGIYARSMKIR